MPIMVLNLHSSMDRLKLKTDIPTTAPKTIYIPVWID